MENAFRKPSERRVAIIEITRRRVEWLSLVWFGLHRRVELRLTHFV